jgi:hypothetical protein
MPEIWREIDFPPQFVLFYRLRVLGFEKRLVWKILLGQKGSKISLGQK